MKNTTNVKTVNKELSINELKIGRCYRAKKPRPAGQFASYANDRQVMRIGSTTVQYDGPSVHAGCHYPTISKEKFLAWASHDVTDELPPGEWQIWPIPKS
ncbi:hypothetical protein EGH53_03270 [Klebsiella aerogenes]|nr:hypothetical protein EGH53_03270 [Klebsiella aerogenes]